MSAKDELEELIDELANDDPAIRSRVAAAVERRELERVEENEYYARPENQEPQGPPRRRRT